jgi:hypothetical protein
MYPQHMDSDHDRLVNNKFCQMVASSSSNLPFPQTFASSAIAACTAEVR